MTPNEITPGDAITDTWQGCYDLSYRGIIVDEAFCHPAKMSRGLLTRILRHAKEEEWLWPGAVIVDPFGGIFTTGLLGAYEGYQVVGVELESEFYRLANSYDCPGLTKAEWVRWFNRYRRNPDICPACHNKAQTWYEKHSGVIPSQEPHHFVGNIELHARKLAALGCPQPVIIQGDSRRLCEILQQADLILSSPPYSETGLQNKTDPEKKRQHLQELVATGQITGRESIRVAKKGWNPNTQVAGQDSYGTTPGQLGAMRPGSIDCVLSSPPFMENNVNIGAVGNTLAQRQQIHDSKPRKDSYGTTAGQLGAMKPGDVSAIISSPPYEGTEIATGTASQADIRDRKQRRINGTWEGYNKANKDNLGSTQGDTFWSAAKIIVDQCLQILRPGGYAIWVVKDFVRNKKRVDFTGDWRRLCESVGFKTLHEHHAMLIKETEHQTFFGPETTIKEKKSFFRRLCESKGSPKIDFETIYCMCKPKG